MMNKKRFYSILLIVYVLLMVAGAILPGTEIVKEFSSYDKLLHFSEFFFLMIILLKTVECYTVKNVSVLSFIIGIIFVFLSEIAQLYVPSREFSYYDMIADIAGLILGFMVYMLLFRKKSTN